MKRKSLIGVLIASIAIFSQSCDSDFNEIGSDIFGDDGFGFEALEEFSPSFLMPNSPSDFFS